MADPTEGFHPRAVLLVHAFTRPLRRATIAGVAGGISAGAVAGIAMGLSVPWPVAIAIVGAVTVLLGLAVALLVLPTKARRAYEAFSWVGHREIARFRERTGTRTPATPAECHAWLARNPPGPTVGAARIELLIMVGAFDAARAEFAALPPPASDLERLERAGLRAYGELVETGSHDATALDAAIAALPAGSDVAREGTVVRAIAAARLRLARGEPEPLGPLLAVRASLGREATRAVLQDTWRPFALTLLSFGVMLEALVLVIDAVIQ